MSMNWTVELEEKGFAKIPGVFTKEETDHMREAAYGCLAKPLNGRISLQQTGDHPVLLLWPNDVHPYLNQVSKDDRLASIVRQYLGRYVLHLNNQIYFREPDDGDEFAWHQDISFRIPPQDFIGIESSYLQTIIAIDPITKDNGAIEFIPGSHKRGDLNLIARAPGEYGLRKFIRGKWQGEKVLAEPGDVIAWSVMVVHGSEANNSNNSRMTFMNGFARDTAVIPGKFDHYMKDGVVV